MKEAKITMLLRLTTRLLYYACPLNVEINAIFLLVLICFMGVGFPNNLEALDKTEIYLAGYGMVTQPSSKGISFKDSDILGEKINGEPGLGLKIGLFPSFLCGYLGMELESFGQNNSMSFQEVGNGMFPIKGESRLVTYSSMLNLMLRYPGRYARPYVGLGGGLSNGLLHKVEIPGRKNRNVEIGSALGHQIFGGIQLVSPKNWFIFLEYKYSAANYHWNQLSLNFRSEYFLGGIGYLF